MLSTDTLAGSAERVARELHELAALTSTEAGAQRVAWGPVWRRARDWFRGKVAELGLSANTDSAGNLWVVLPGISPRTVIIGGHIDSVPNGGWLDGSLDLLTGLEALRRYAHGPKPPVTLALVDWADEEGARFGRSLLGSSAAGGSLDLEEVRGLTDRHGITLVDALRDNGVSFDAMLDAHRALKAIDARAYLELHIEQGPVLESAHQSAGVVLGTYGLERHMVRFVGQTAHSGSTPIPLRRDAFLAAAATALECREIARRHSKATPGGGCVCTVGVVKVEPSFVTAVPGACEISLDQRALDGAVLADMLREATEAAARFARENDVTVEWTRVWRIDPRPFDPALIALCADAIEDVTGSPAVHLASGPLHDGAEMVPHMPVVMMFVYSSKGLSHCPEEDTPFEHLETAIRAFLLLVDKTMRIP